MNAKELRQKSAADLKKELLGLRREQFNLRMARATGQAAKPDQFTKVRRNIARLKTVMGEQQRSASKGTAAPAAAKGKKA
jgi:large subunit ribosomal protein L29